MGRIIFVLGGAKSGKSAHALWLAEEQNSVMAKKFIATAQALDDEMAARIKAHQMERDPSWDTYEEPLLLSNALAELAQPSHIILVDCLTLWLTNMMVAEKNIEEEFSNLQQCLRKIQSEENNLSIILVSNEVGLSIAPENKMARDFRDHQGYLNQIVAAQADQVDFVMAGIAKSLKP